MAWFEELNSLEQRALTATGRNRSDAIRKLGLRKQTVSGWFGQTVAPDFDTVRPLIELYLGWAAEPADRCDWKDLHEAARGSRRSAEPEDGGWADLVRAHPLWTYVADSAALREQSARLAGELGRAWSTAGSGDPWHDPALPGRWLDRVGTLARWADLRELAAAEAALLTLVPLLHLAHQRATADALTPLVSPDTLGADAPAGPERGSFRGYLLGHPWLVRRAEAPELPGRRPAAHEIGHWLLRRWVLEKRPVDPSVVTDLLGPAEGDLRVVLDRRRTGALLRVLRFGPARLADDDALELALAEHLDLPGAHRDEAIRPRLLGLLLALARPLALDAADLPTVLVEHLGVPHGVELDSVRARLGQARWHREGPGAVPRDCVLEAFGDDPATLLALRDHVDAVDLTLRAVHRAAARHDALAPLRSLPTGAIAHRVEPAPGHGRAAGFSARTARFTVDERRLRELLMGDQLYGDPQLAVRELYQNALDACRHRRARIEYQFRSQGLDCPPDAYRGEITFVQGTDDSGRPYLECRDNGVGMGEEELSGVFSRAGLSFTGTEEFAEEQAEWERYGIRMFPNSRFGIGVLSYFMLADEIRVTTCRMHRRRGPGPVLRATVAGPGHLFRIEYPEQPAPTPHTAVRLYLRDGALTRSCVEVLQELVAVSEFTLSAEDWTADPPRTARWHPWRYTGAGRRLQPNGRREAVLVHTAMQPDGHVIWADRRGEVLVDGIRTSGVRSSEQGDRATWIHAVVNLCGPHQVALSVDRKTITEDVSDRVSALLRGSVAELIGSREPLVDLDWIAAQDYDVADLVVREAVTQQRKVPINRRVVDLGAAGFFAPDLHLLDPDHSGRGRAEEQRRRGIDRHQAFLIQDHLFLWRLIGLDLLGEYPQLADLIDLRSLGPVEPALPSDARFLAIDSSWDGAYSTKQLVVLQGSEDDGSWLSPQDAERLAVLGLRPAGEFDDLDRKLLGAGTALGTEEPSHIDVAGLLDLHRLVGCGLRELADRLRRLGCQVDLPDAVPDWPDNVDLTLLTDSAIAVGRWPDVGCHVGLSQLVFASELTGLTFDHIVRRLSRYGYHCAPHPPGSAAAREGDSALFSQDGDGLPPWIDSERPVDALHLLLVARAQALEPADVAARLTAYGLEVADLSALEITGRIDIALFTVRFDGSSPRLDPRRPVPARHVVRAADRCGIPIPVVLRQLGELGYRTPEGLHHLTEADARFLDVLCEVDGHGGGGGDCIDIAAVQHLAGRLGLQDAEVVDRLERFGLTVLHGRALAPDAPPADLNLLSRGIDRKAPWYRPGEKVPYSHVVRCALTLGLPVEQIAEQLRAHGLDVRVPAGDRPGRDDLVLLSVELDGLNPWLPVDARVTLGRLAAAARAVNRPLGEVAARMWVLGLQVGDPEEMVAAALERVPWRRGEGGRNSEAR
ncbi:hypothetical protein ACGFX4_26210 [Kitasatospora sp. NPDC048365]|uniref:wHTH domain-containing protein n=1 Tax=Kitasatospora sp. NPDC048365 TaxID=3364050 RepID=UPI0037175E7B